MTESDTKPGRNAPRKNAPWAVSMHGGHSGEFCAHAQGTLRETVEAAVTFGYHTIGIAEHAPRPGAPYLYTEEIEQQWDGGTLHRLFDDYARALAALQREFANRIAILRGFEVEAVPATGYIEATAELRIRYAFDYIVGSIHWVDDQPTDFTRESFEAAAARYGGVEELAVRYYEVVTEMATALKPEVIGHLDLIRKLAVAPERVDTPRVQEAARRVLEAAEAYGGIIDINTSALRRGDPTPYPAPWLLRLAVNDYGLGVCFGDDSHGPGMVGAGIIEARDYLLENGVRAITYLAREGRSLVRREAAL